MSHRHRSQDTPLVKARGDTSWSATQTWPEKLRAPLIRRVQTEGSAKESEMQELNKKWKPIRNVINYKF